MEADRKNAIEAGCDEFHTKPIDLATLLKQINQLTSQ
jgi:CheY-like chemotaxis protein